MKSTHPCSEGIILAIGGEDGQWLRSRVSLFHSLLWRWLVGFRRRHHIALVSAIFIGATSRGAFLGSLLKQEGRVALRAFLFHRLVPEDRVALRIICAAIED